LDAKAILPAGAGEGVAAGFGVNGLGVNVGVGVGGLGVNVDVDVGEDGVGVGIGVDGKGVGVGCTGVGVSSNGIGIGGAGVGVSGVNVDLGMVAFGMPQNAKKSRARRISPPMAPARAKGPPTLRMDGLFGMGRATAGAFIRPSNAARNSETVRQRLLVSSSTALKIASSVRGEMSGTICLGGTSLSSPATRRGASGGTLPVSMV